jgi:hypothetical protein
MKVSRMTKYPYLDPASVSRKVIFDPIDTLGSTEGMENPKLLCDYYSWDIPRLETAEDFARLAAISGRFFFRM